MKLHLLLIAGLFFFLPVQADTISSSSSATVAKLKNAPTRGMSMKNVRKKYGKPLRVHKSKGKVKKDWPRITRWEYGKYSVYFERRTVLHTVVHSK